MENIINSKVFIVEDDAFSSLLLKKHITDLGFHDISEYQSGLSCLEDLYQNPEIILLDHQMDELDGFDTLVKIKRQIPNAFVIMVSSQEDMKTTIKLLKFGAFDYIVKDEEELQNLDNALSRISMLKEKMKATQNSFLAKLNPFH